METDRAPYSFRADTDGQGHLSLRLVRWDGDSEFEVTEVGRYKREAKAVLGAVNRALDAHVGHGLGREMCQGGRWMGLGFGVTPECAADLRAALALPEQGVLL